MTPAEPLALAFVFDLDDTLYAERDYVSSCFAWVASALGAPDAKAELEAAFDGGARDPIGDYCTLLGVDEAARRKLIADMRDHTPDIDLSPDAARFLSRLRADARPYSIVTNGRSGTQRRKIEALGLTDALSIAISEETGAAKPDAAAYQPAIDAHAPARFIYVGDNIRKDFFAPNEMGWMTVMRRTDTRGIHDQTVDAAAAYHPQRVIDAMDELVDLLDGR